MSNNNSRDTSDLLNDLLVRIYRGLLQYSVECWPWTDAEESAEKRAVERMAAAQQQHIRHVVDLLTERGVVVDFGNYPDNSELHYVSLDYLLRRLVADEQQIVGALESAQGQFIHDPAGAGLVSELLASEKRHLSELRELAQSHAAV